MAVGLIVGAIATMVVGAAMQAKAASDAASRQRQATEAAMRRQAEFQRQAEERAMEQANKYQGEERKQTQDDLAESLTQAFYQPVQAAQETNNQRTTTGGAVSSDYLAAKSHSNANQQKMAQELAGLFGKQKSALRMRENEAVGMADAASDIGRIGNFANGQYNVDKMKIDEAGQPNSTLNILGGLATTAGSMGLSAGISDALKPTDSTKVSGGTIHKSQ